MAVIKRTNLNGRLGNTNFNLFQLCLGILLGAFGINLWIDQDAPIETTTSWLSQLPPYGDSKGWHPIHVFYGEKEGLFNDAPASIKSSQESFAQVGQDSIVLDLIGSNGYFIDLAANDALDLTNTLALESKGWAGLCVEPNSAYWYGLSHRKCTVVGALVAGTKSEQMKVKFRGVFGGIVGKLDNRLANRKKEPDASEVTRYTAPISEVLNKFQVPRTIDYMSLDVEGSEYEIMKDFPFETYTIRLLTVESPNKQLKALLQEKGYLYLAEIATWGEYLWCHKSTGFTPDHEQIKAIKSTT